MSNNNYTWLFVGGAALLIGAVFLNTDNRINTKEKAVVRIVESFPSINVATLNTFGEGYLIAWATALENKSASFGYEGKFYATRTGLAQQFPSF